MAKLEKRKRTKVDRQYNKEVDAYKYFVVNNETKRVESGFEFESDAKDLKKELDENHGVKGRHIVLTEAGLRKYGIENPKEKWKAVSSGSSAKSEEMYFFITEPGFDDNTKTLSELVKDEWDSELIDYAKKLSIGEESGVNLDKAGRPKLKRITKDEWEVLQDKNPPTIVPIEKMEEEFDEAQLKEIDKIVGEEFGYVPYGRAWNDDLEEVHKRVNEIKFNRRVKESNNPIAYTIKDFAVHQYHSCEYATNKEGNIRIISHCNLWQIMVERHINPEILAYKTFCSFLNIEEIYFDSIPDAISFINLYKPAMDNIIKENNEYESSH